MSKARIYFYLSMFLLVLATLYTYGGVMAYSIVRSEGLAIFHSLIAYAMFIGSVGLFSGSVWEISENREDGQ